MTGTFLADLSGQERIEAVHDTFASKSSVDAFTFLMWALLFVAAMVGLLVLLNRVQQRRQQRSAKKPPAAGPEYRPVSPSTPPFMGGPKVTRRPGSGPFRPAGRHP